MADLKDIVVNNAKNFQKYANDFYRVFGVGLKKYWLNHILGFDIVTFDTEVIKSGEKAMAEVVREKYGEEGLQIIEALIK
jgi:hypothetical protein